MRRADVSDSSRGIGIPAHTPEACVTVALAILFLCFRAVAGDFEQANEHYDAGRFAQAKQGYEQLVDAGQPSANVWYNLANADYRLGAVGRAILGYERALALEPHHAEALANVKLLREQTHARDLERSFAERALLRGSEEAWTIVTAVAGWIVVLAVVFLCTRRGTSVVTLGALATGALLVAAAGAVALRLHAQDRTLAIVTAREAEAHLAPVESAAVAGFLPAGSRVRVLSERGPWTYCVLPDARRGWLPAAAVERIRPASL